MEKTENNRLPGIGKDKNHLLDHVRVFALDMDGTVYLGTKWIDGAKDFLDRIREAGKEFFFLTNNSSKNPDAYVKKLSDMGYPVERDRIITSGQATIWYLKEHFPKKRVCLLGNRLLQEEFRQAGIPLSDTDPEVCVLGFDTELSYQKLCAFCDGVRGGLPYIATHPDLNCPTETGYIPDAGSFIALVGTSTGRRPDKVIGKPNAEITEYLLERLREQGLSDVSRREIAMVGDRLYTDVAAGVNGGLVSVFVLSGEGTMEDAAVSESVPDLIYRSVADIPV